MYVHVFCVLLSTAPGFQNSSRMGPVGLEPPTGVSTLINSLKSAGGRSFTGLTSSWNQASCTRWSAHSAAVGSLPLDKNAVHSPSSNNRSRAPRAAQLAFVT